MSLFKKTKINQNMKSFINNGEGVGIVKVKGYGKASARVESYKFILESYGEEYPIIESISAITYLSYDPGNFFQEPKITVGIGQKEYVLAGVNNNDDEIDAFYQTILSLKKQDKTQKPINNEERKPKPTQEKVEEIDEITEVENQIKENKKTSGSNKIKNFIKRKRDPQDLEAVLDEEPEETPLKEQTTKEAIKENKEEPTNENKSEIEKIEEMEDVDEFDEIDDFEEFDDFEVDEEIIIGNDDGEDIGTLVEESDTVDDFIIEDEEEFDKTTGEVQPEEVVEEPKPEPEKVVEEPKPEPEKIVEQPKTPQKEIKPEPTKKTTNIPEVKNEITEEVAQAKTQVNENIKDINQEISNQNNISSENDPSDPVYQIRRYYELKEDGIITEEEFEQKKKQLLGL